MVYPEHKKRLSEVFKINLYLVFLTVRAHSSPESATIALITPHKVIQAAYHAMPGQSETKNFYNHLSKETN